MTYLQEISGVLHPFPVPVGECECCPWNFLHDFSILMEHSDRPVKRIGRLKKEIDGLHISASILVSMETQ